MSECVHVCMNVRARMHTHFLHIILDELCVLACIYDLDVKGKQKHGHQKYICLVYII